MSGTHIDIKAKLPLYHCLTKHHAIKMYWGSGGIVPHKVTCVCGGHGEGAHHLKRNLH